METAPFMKFPTLETGKLAATGFRSESESLGQAGSATLLKVRLVYEFVHKTWERGAAFAWLGLEFWSYRGRHLIPWPPHPASPPGLPTEAHAQEKGTGFEAAARAGRLSSRHHTSPPEQSSRVDPFQKDPVPTE